MSARRIGRWRAALVMAAIGALGAAVFFSGFAADRVAYSVLIACSALSCALIGAWVMPWFATRPRFGWLVAALGGVVSTALAFVVFAPMLIGLTGLADIADPSRPPPSPQAMGEMILFLWLVGPVVAGPLAAPLGAVGGLACRAFSRAA